MSFPDPVQSLLQPGTRLDRFELIGLVARGGMAEVWLARLAGPHGVERLFAVKTILPQLVAEQHFHRLFIDEARIASRIDHPNVARIHELGEHEGVPYVVMDWIDGDSLDVVLSQLGTTAMPPSVACRIVADACAGLHAAHELRAEDGELLGVVHRDISPSNILVDRHGVAKIIDFGVARARDRLAEKTATGVIRGKLSYMSREQALGATIDRRADVWAMGAVLHRILAASHPFEGRTPLESMRRVLDGQSPAALPDTIPAALKAVVARALDHDVNARIESAAAMRSLLLEVMEQSGMRCTTDDVAEFLGKLLHQSNAARQEFVAAALQAARTRATQPAPVPATTPPAHDFPASPPALQSPAKVPERISSLPSVRARRKSVPHPPPRRNDRKFAIILVISTAVLIAAGAKFWLSTASVPVARDRLSPVHESSSGSSSPAALASDSPTPPASASAPVRSGSSSTPTASAPASARPPTGKPPGSSWMRDYGF